MKITKLLLLSGIAILIASCSKDDDTSGSNTGLPGKWKTTSIEYVGVSTTESGGDVVMADFTGSAYDINHSLEFKESPNEFISAGDYNIRLETTALGQTYTFDLYSQTFFVPGTWERDGSKITITSQGNDPQEVEIIELTETSLVLGGDITQVNTTQGATVTYEISAILMFERQ